ncbi:MULTISPECIES: response regulator [unclassified Lysinibacillus]|uniref:response regulator n=1 Tax=unclassified Lysinibacillus TaxID=2636778 RepID=UPI0038143D13
MNEVKLTKANEIMQEQDVKKYFEIMLESVIRSHMTITTIFLKSVKNTSLEVDHSNVNTQIAQFLKENIRKTDLLFQLEDREHWGIVFLQSSDVEANAFLQRIFNLLKKDKKISNQVALKASITEIRNNHINFDLLLAKNKELLADDDQPNWFIEHIDDYRIQTIEHVKVSIIEQNAIFRKVLETTLKSMDIANFTFEVTAYEDGYSFLQSKSYQSGHLHLIIMNDILPRNNGLEILHSLRSMPNEKKFIIYMMSERNSEIAALNAYEGGVDEFIVKPFNLRLLEAKIKRTFARYWL